MKADPAAQVRLLDLQALDSRLDRLRHQRANPSEAAEIKTLTARRAETDGWVRDQRIIVDDLHLAQSKADEDVELVKARRKRDQDRIDAGQISNPKDLERMQAEMVSLERRVSTLEDEELEVMERLEEAQTGLNALETDLAAVDTELTALVSARDAKDGELASEAEQVTGQRGPIVAALPEDLLALYDRIRAKSGTGAAMLRARQCGGCMLTLDAAEIAAIRARPTDDVVRCEECQRILVRTSESGL